MVSPNKGLMGGLFSRGIYTCQRVIPEHAQVKVIIEKEKSHWALWHLPLTPALDREEGRLLV